MIAVTAIITLNCYLRVHCTQAVTIVNAVHLVTKKFNKIENDKIISKKFKTWNCQP